MDSPAAASFRVPAPDVPDAGVASRFAFSVLFPDRRGELDGPKVCRICGGPCRYGIPYGQMVTEVWAAEGIVRRPDSGVVCPACVWAHKAGNPSTDKDGLALGVSLIRDATGGYAVSLSGLRRLVSRAGDGRDVPGKGDGKKPSGDRLRILLFPPDPPAVVVIRASNDDFRRNQMLHAGVSPSWDPMLVLVGTQQVWYSPARLLALARDGLPKPNWRRWPWPYRLLGAAVGGDWDLLETILREGGVL